MVAFAKGLRGQWTQWTVTVSREELGYIYVYLFPDSKVWVSIAICPVTEEAVLCRSYLRQPLSNKGY